MSIVGALQDYFSQFGGMKLLTDHPDGTTESYAIMPTGNGAIARDVIGGAAYKNSYVLYACESLEDEADRAATHDLLERLQDWIEEQSYQGKSPQLPDPFQVEELTASNGMLFDVMDNGLGLYQIQINMKFTRRNKNA